MGCYPQRFYPLSILRFMVSIEFIYPPYPNKLSNRIYYYLPIYPSPSFYLQDPSVSFSQELYKNFSYQKPREFFHTFETDSHVAGFSFADQSEATEFYRKVTSVSFGGAGPTPSPSPSPSPSSPTLSRSAYNTNYNSSTSPVNNNNNTPSSSSYNQFSSSTPPASLSRAQSVYVSKKGSEKRSTWFGGLFGAKEDDSLLISEPTNFIHKSSIGWNPDSGFEVGEGNRSIYIYLYLSLSIMKSSRC